MQTLCYTFGGLQIACKGDDFLNLILCDDEQIFLDALQQKISNWAKQSWHSSGIMIRSFTSSEDLLDTWQHGMAVDALLLDIQIPGETSGMAVAKVIHQCDEYIPIVFITSFGEYAAEGYTVNALRYLHKPVSTQAVAEVMDILWHRWSLRKAECLTVDLPNQLLRLPLESIIYIEVSGRFCTLHTTDHHQSYQIRQPLDVLREKLPDSLFAQCHRSAVVNLMYIRNIVNGKITLSTGNTLSMSRSYQPQLIRQFRQYYLGGTSEC